MNDYNLEYIDKLRIHELRDVAKRLGVSSPTTMKKDALIIAINSIINGNEENADSRLQLKQQKELDFFTLLTSNSSVLDTLLAESDVKGDNKETASNTIIAKKNVGIDSPYKRQELYGCFSYKISQNECQYGDSNDYDVFGYVDIHENGFGILRQEGFVPSNKDIYISSGFVKKYNLKKGNFIHGKAKYIIENQPKIVCKITKIEDSDKAKKTIIFEEFPYHGNGQPLILRKFNADIKRGERQYIEKMSLKEAVDLGYDLVDENGVSVKLINVKARPEEQYSSHQKMQVVNIPFNKTESEVVTAVELVLERIKREFEMGQSNVLMIYNFCELIRGFNIACEGVVDYTKFNSQALNKIYNILYMTKTLENQVSCTVVCIDKNGITSDLQSIIELELLPLFNKTYNVLNYK